MQSPKPAKVIIEKTPTQEFVGNLFIPDINRVKPMDGKVVAIGSDVKDLRVGDHVLVEWRHGGTEQFSRNGKDYWLLNERQVLAIIG